MCLLQLNGSMNTLYVENIYVFDSIMKYSRINKVLLLNFINKTLSSTDITSILEPSHTKFYLLVYFYINGKWTLSDTKVYALLSS